MADSVPVCNVLTEAIEYLTKLGTNIRIRSESLKDKRIRKDKLKNTHAVFKAVDKVLLICELSKKSIENVETGVKKLLSQMEMAGATMGPDPETRECSGRTIKFEYFTYESRQLKIRDKISLGHYTSVKVVSTSMSLTMIEKYPVYHDCKLYQIRNERRNDSDLTKSLTSKHCLDLPIIHQEEKSAFETKENHSQQSECVGGSESNVESMEIFESIQNKEIENEEQNTEENYKENFKYEGNLENLDKEGKGRISFEEDKDENVSTIKPKKRKVIDKFKKFKHIKVLDDSSSSDVENCKNTVEKHKEDDVVNMVDVAPQDHLNTEVLSNKTIENKDVTEMLQTNETIKPVIKCVSLSKLLKPDRVSELSMSTTEESKSKTKKSSERKHRPLMSKFQKDTNVYNKNQKKLNVSDEDDNEHSYWAHKRSEVKNFKPKKLYINIARLPNITKSFLEKYNLKKVTQMESVLCEIEKDMEMKKRNKKKEENETTCKKMKLINDSEHKNLVDINNVKCALLDDSDSDNGEGGVVSKNPLQTSQNKEQRFSNDTDTYKSGRAELDHEDEVKHSDDSHSKNTINTTGMNEKMQDSDNQSTEVNKNKLADCNQDLTSVLPIECCSKTLSEEKQLDQNTKVVEDCEEQMKKIFQSDPDNVDVNFKKVKGNNLQEATCNFQISHNEKTEVNKEKHALLDMSDDELQNEDDKGDKPSLTKKSIDHIKESLLNESDCDPEILQKSNSNSDKEKNIKDGLAEDYERYSEHELKRSRSKDTEIVKSSLLQDSSDDISKTPKKRKRHSGDSPPLSKRKHIMESMYAKKMLLTYSSSSDTDDEDLRNTIKEIKNSLLKGVSSDEQDTINTKESPEKDDERSVSENNSEESESEKGIVKNNEMVKSNQSDSDSKDTSCKEPTCGSVSDNSNKDKMGPSSASPGGSCSQNSDIEDTHDKEIDGLINLKSLEKTHRRRQPQHRARRRAMAKASGLISSEGFLEAESSSDGGSVSSDHADNADLEDIPRVTLSDMNGDGIEHLAKDDLLGESDTSASHDEKKNFKKEDESDEDNVKSKRRKAVAISSDSEVGSSRRKGHGLKMSDTEDSDDDASEPANNKRKKKNVADSDASGGSSSDGKKKRRRIKTIDDSDGSGSDTDNEGRNKHGRKNIRKVMGKNQLEEATKKAAREEKERIARISERQKLYNNLEFDESGKPDEVVLEKVVLDFDPETKEPLIQVDRGLVKKLKPHQANGIKFMWDACFESVKRIKKDKGSGCILAHCMGLGKTLQVVSLTHTLLAHGSLTGVRRVLVVCPLSTVLNWVNEFAMWLRHADGHCDVDVYELSKFKQNSERAFQLSQWFEGGGVCVLGYEMFRNLSADKGKKFKKKILKNFQESLVDPGPDLVVCDEGHLLKNEKTSLSQSMNRVKTRRRIVLTGTPLQNNLKEYYCMVQFVKPNLLGKYNEYLNRFVNPITNGQYTDSTEHDIRVMKRRSHVLHKMLDGAVQRRDYGVLAPFLPPKHEYVLFITLTDVQIKLYHHYLDNYSRKPQPGKSSGFLFPDFQSLQRIWTHPMVLKYNSERYEIMQQRKREREEEDSEGSLIDFIDDDSTPDESSTEESSEDLSDLSDDSRKKSKKKKSGKKGKGKDSKASTRRGTRANPIEIDDEEPAECVEVKSENPTEWWMRLVSEEELEDMRNSHKLVLLFDILRQCEAIGDKLLVFSQSLYSLDLIEYFLGKVDEATQAGRVDEKLAGHVGSWSTGVDYFRLDGSTSCENRSIWCKNFNRIDNQRARLFLISTRAGGLGINLVAANRVVIFDVSWNPSHDVQSIFRVYRFGQKKPCYVYRFLAMGTMEEKIYERQVTKQAISKRVIDEQQIDRHYAENDLAELYKFEPQPPAPRPLPPLPRDRLFAEMLKEHETQIYKYHEHDSLLENKEEETLSEEERRAAWEDFENEKTRPPPQPFLSPYAMHNGMMQGLLAQQQQMALAAISAMLHKNAPNMTEKQIRENAPLLLAANPGLISSMSEMYKYPQPGMMNHPMMNPMNAAGGGDMSGGSGLGASALHYEPPWQRQQQQQQQLRLQQLMQHQNSMGAKYYAGGLGSRDPMAMALQQQRARELMHRPRARGRPPLAAAPRAPGPATDAPDVVNLDSD